MKNSYSLKRTHETQTRENCSSDGMEEGRKLLGEYRAPHVSAKEEKQESSKALRYPRSYPQWSSLLVGPTAHPVSHETSARYQQHRVSSAANLETSNPREASGEYCFQVSSLSQSAVAERKHQANSAANPETSDLEISNPEKPPGDCGSEVASLTQIALRDRNLFAVMLGH
mmetsp:Transcript_18824/g.29403  ORF Transcript_18824/g.29403 Transcript_18824/m.29403 type:complete len:171 (-) Transcript_18824:144-656(-)